MIRHVPASGSDGVTWPGRRASLAHAHAHPHSQGRHSTSRRLALALALTLLYTAAEIVGGLVSGSLALLADAGHMMTDNMALGLALLAAWFSTRPPDTGRTYGHQRAEFLAALTNGIVLVVICVYIFWEAYQRLQSPPAVRAELMAFVAAAGLVVNVIAAWILRGGHGHVLNVRAAFLRVVGDLLGSVGALVAAGLVAAFGWLWADPAASVFIGLVIIFSSIRLVLDSVNVLMEGAPGHLDLEEVRGCLCAIEGVGSVHDLHVWTLGGGAPILTAHLVLDHSVTSAKVLRAATLSERFGIAHGTLRVEPPDFNIVQQFLEPTGSRRD